MNKNVGTVLAIFSLIGVVGVYDAQARPEYARKEQKDCVYCHLSSNGGVRGFRGMYYGGNKLSFGQYDEKRESGIAGVKEGVTGAETRPAVAYLGNVTGPAAPQIQLQVLRRPVVLLFVNEATPEAKAAVKKFAELAKAYGTNAAFIAVAPGEADDAIKLATDLESKVRVLPDSDGKAAKNFSATKAMDMAVVADKGDAIKPFAGYSKANLDAALEEVAKQGADRPTIDLTNVPTQIVRGKDLGKS